MAGFRNAVAAHTRRYQAHGHRIEQRVAPVMVLAKGKAGAPSLGVITPVTGDDVSRERHDSRRTALVANNRANPEEIEKDTIVRMPKG